VLLEAEPVEDLKEEDVAQVFESGEALSQILLSLLLQILGVDIQADGHQVHEQREVGEVGVAEELVQHDGQLEQRVEAFVCPLVHVGAHSSERLVDDVQARVLDELDEVCSRALSDMDLAWQLGEDLNGAQRGTRRELLEQSGIVGDVESEQQLPKPGLHLFWQHLVGYDGVDHVLGALLGPLSSQDDACLDWCPGLLADVGEGLVCLRVHVHPQPCFRRLLVDRGLESAGD